MQEKNLVFDEQLKKRIEEYVWGRHEPLTLKHMIAEALKTEASTTGFSVSELEWLQSYMHFLPPIVNSTLCSSVLYLFGISNGLKTNFISTRLGKYNSEVSYWLQKLVQIELVYSTGPKTAEERKLLQGWRFTPEYYLKIKEYPNLMNLVLDWIKQKYGADSLKAWTSKNDNKQLKATHEYRKNKTARHAK